MRKLENEIQNLPLRQQKVIEMLYRRQLSTTECARVLGVNKAQVSRDHAKAIDHFRDALGAGLKADDSAIENVA